MNSGLQHAVKKETRETRGVVFNYKSLCEWLGGHWSDWSAGIWFISVGQLVPFMNFEFSYSCTCLAIICATSFCIRTINTSRDVRTCQVIISANNNRIWTTNRASDELIWVTIPTRTATHSNPRIWICFCHSSHWFWWVHTYTTRLIDFGACITSTYEWPSLYM